MKIPQIDLSFNITKSVRRLINNKANNIFNFPKRTIPETDIVEISEFTKRLQSLEESKTMKKLFSPEFKTPQGKNSDGYYVTTIIDNDTGKPVKAYVKLEQGDENSEKWYIFIKNIRNSYQEIGVRHFEIDMNKNIISPGYMENRSYPFSGVGIRLHQIGIERMMQKSLDNVQICSTEEAFPFHYKCGFRIIPIERTMDKNAFIEMLKTFSKDSGIDIRTLYKNAEIISKNSDIIKFSTKKIENWRKLLYAQGKNIDWSCNCPMRLSKEALAQWKEYIKLQPIFEH